MQVPARSLLSVLAFWVSVAVMPPNSAAQDLSPERLQSAIDALLTRAPLENAIWGIEVRDLLSGEVLYARNPTTSLIPASTTKLATTAAAIERLGPDFRLETGLYVDGEIVNGTLMGDLVIRGAGDPTIAEDLERYGARGVLRAWVDSVRAVGVRRIRGEIVGDDDVFDDVAYGPGWQWDDLRFYYAPEVSGLSYNENVVHFTLRGTRLGAPTDVTWEPNTDYVRVRNQTLTTARGAGVQEEYDRTAEDNWFELRSRVPIGSVERERLTVHNPTLYFAYVFRETLRDAGIEVEGLPRDIDQREVKPRYEGLQRIARHESPPIAELAALVNKPSHNLAAESLLKTLGRGDLHTQGSTTAGTWERGSRVVREMLGRAGVDTAHVRLVDGSGLSRMNVVTAQALGALLRYMWFHPDETVRSAYVASLSVGGEDGTLSGRFASGPARGRVHARTGTMTSVSALAGYLTRDHQPPITFVLICNNHLVPSRHVRTVQDEVVNLLARLSL